jgi:hypothetical protein
MTESEASNSKTAEQVAGVEDSSHTKAPEEQKKTALDIVSFSLIY